MSLAPTFLCGRKPHRIVGGSEAGPYSLPWQVGLVRKNSQRPFCGSDLCNLPKEHVGPFHPFTRWRTKCASLPPSIFSKKTSEKIDRVSDQHITFH